MTTLRRLLPLLLLLLVVTPEVPAQAPTPVFEPIGMIDHPPIGETSGIARSNTYEDVYWVHNDSGDGPRLYAVDGKGNAIMPGWQSGRHFVGPKEKGGGKEAWPGMELLLAYNYDWEDIAIDGDTIYVAEMGNNANARRDLGVYVLKEPNPRETARMRCLAFLPVAYPDQQKFPAEKWHFDGESLFVSDGKLYFITKHRPVGKGRIPEAGAKLYRLDTKKLAEENVLTLVETRKDLAWAMAADLSPDGKKLAVLCVNGLFVFDKPAEGDRWLSGKTRRVAVPIDVLMKQPEALCWDDDETLRVACEKRSIYRVRLDRLTPVK